MSMVTAKLTTAPAHVPHHQSRVRRALHLMVHQVSYDMLSIVRNRQAQFFVMAMPVGFLLLFCAIFGNGWIGFQADRVRASTYYVANLTTFGIVDIACMSLVIGLVDSRESGVLRRRQATPQPSWVILMGRAVTVLVMSIATACLLLAIGRLAFGASIPLNGVPSLLASVVIGSITFCCIGFALTSVIKAVQSAQPVAMAVMMPLFFISGIFIPWVIIPDWLQHVANVFPMRHLSLSLLTPFISHAGQSSWSPGHLLVTGAWAVAGLVVALTTFKWAPQDR
jgi:ABC-2 type transport system permease protein